MVRFSKDESARRSLSNLKSGNEDMVSREEFVRRSISNIKSYQELKDQYGSFKDDRLLTAISKKISLESEDVPDSVPRTVMRRKEKMPKRSESRKARIRSGLVSFCPEASLSDLSKITETQTWFRRNRSRVYAYLVPLLTLYYFVPAIQISFLSRQPKDLIGSRDMCYHNFRCSIPLYIFSDFNHVISNATYLLFGVAFNFLVFRKGKTLIHVENVNAKGKYSYLMRI